MPQSEVERQTNGNGWMEYELPTPRRNTAEMGDTHVVANGQLIIKVPF